MDVFFMTVKLLESLFTARLMRIGPIFQCIVGALPPTISIKFTLYIGR